MTDLERYANALAAAFACAQSAWARGDWAAHSRAAKLYKKFKHKWEQAAARASRGNHG